LPVDTPCAEYTEALPDWKLVRDCFKGRRAIKAAGTEYLPTLGRDMPGSLGQPKTYQLYSVRACFYNAVRRTVQGLVGLIFQDPPVLKDAPPILEQALADVTMRGQTLEVFAQELTREVLTVGRVGVLVSWAADGGVRPYAATYIAEDVLAWRTAWTAQGQILTRVVLREYEEMPDPRDPFVMKRSERFRVLELIDGAYTVALWGRDENGKLRETQAPTPPLRRGEPLGFIPFLLLGAAGVSPGVQAPPLLDLADANVGHYRNSADHEYGLHLVALPTPYVAGAVKGGDSGPMLIGPGVLWELTENGEAGMVEFTGQGLAAIREAMDEKKRQMASLGAQLLEEQSGTNETATAVRMRHSGQHATLKTVAQSVEQGLTQLVRWMAFWLFADLAERPDAVKASVELNKEFFSVRATPEEVKAALLLLQSDAISYDTFYERLQVGGWTREGVTAAQERTEIERTPLAALPVQ
jgi:hypothetical protein